MPAKLPVDYNEIRSAYCKGMTLADLAKEYNVPYGALRARASREKWTASVTNVNARIHQSVTEKLASSASQWVTKIDSFVHASLEKLDPSKLNLRDLALAVGVAETADRMARRTYGLDREQQARSGTLVQVNVANGSTAQVKRVGYAGLVDVDSAAQDEAQASPDASTTGPQQPPV